MKSLKETGTDFATAGGMDPKAFFEVMGKWFMNWGTRTRMLNSSLRPQRSCGSRCKSWWYRIQPGLADSIASYIPVLFAHTHLFLEMYY